MKRLIIHIGQPKTGTTSLQHFFRVNRELLDTNGIGYYEPLRQYTPWGGPSNGDFLLAEVLSRLGRPRDIIKREWLDANPSYDVFTLYLDESKRRSLAEEKQRFSEYASRVDTIILSEEALWHYELFYDEFWKTAKEYILECCGENTEIDIVLYLRRQDKWMLSKWKEDSTNDIPNPNDFYETLAEYERIGYMDYYASVKRIADIFGSEHLILRNFERESLVSADIIDDFAYACEIDISGCEFTKPRNRSIDLRIAHAMTLINKGRAKEGLDRLTLYVAAAELAAYRRNLKMTEKDEQIQTAGERMEMLQRYEEGNRLISEKFLNGAELFDNLFSEGTVVRANPIKDRITAFFLILKAYDLKSGRNLSGKIAKVAAGLQNRLKSAKRMKMVI